MTQQRQLISYLEETADRLHEEARSIEKTVEEIRKRCNHEYEAAGVTAYEQLFVCKHCGTTKWDPRNEEAGTT